MKLHFVRSIRGLQNFLAIPIMNPLAGFMIYIYIHIYIYKSIKYNVGCLHTEQHVDVLPSKNQVLWINNIIIMLKYCICN